MEDEQIKETSQQVQDNTSNADGEEGFDKEDLQCRFYREELPNSGELVVVSTQVPSL
jgi:hypothetical protein